MAASQAQVVAAARAWLGTPYHPCADISGVGVDCGMLIVRVYVDLGLCEPFDPRPYAPDWHLHRDEERYLGFLLARCVEVQTPAPGDIVALRLCAGALRARGRDRSRSRPRRAGASNPRLPAERSRVNVSGAPRVTMPACDQHRP